MRRWTSRRVARLATWVLVVPVSVATAAPHSASTSPAVEAPDGATGLSPVAVGTPMVMQAASVTSLGDSLVATPASARKVAGEGVPRRALRAYRLAESALRIVDPACRLSWDVVAAIGELESDHGRRDPRRLGPMRIVPSVWRMVGVDGDADGRRDPRDLDDAALSAATYLCAGDEDLGTDRGRRAVLLRYNRSPEYANLALRVAIGYEHTVDDLPPLAAVAMGPDGPGVDVGLGTPGEGVLIGGSDDVSEHQARGSTGRQGGHGHGHGHGHHGGSGDDRGRGPKRPPGDQSHQGDDKPDAGAGDPASRPDRPAGDGQGKGNGDGKPGGSDGPGSGPRPPRSAKPPKPTRPPEPRDNSGHGPDRPNPPRPGEGPDRPDPSKPPKAAEYTGAVEACGGGFCLNTAADVFRLKGSQPFATYVGEQVAVTGVLRGGVLTASAVVAAA